jgi:hypothetical protein
LTTPGTNVPAPTFGATGFIAPLESAVETGVQEDFQQAFTSNGGPPLNFTTNAGSNTNPTPQAQLADSLTAIIGMRNDMFLLFTNLVDPALTFGRMQDAIGRIYYVTRIPAFPTVFTGSIIGPVNGAPPAGFTATDQLGNTYTLLAPVTIPSSGNVSAVFTATVPGPTPVPVTISTFQAGYGVDAINVLGGTIGSNQETPQQFEARRSQSTGWLSTGPLGAIIGAVLAVPGVVDAYVTDNSTGTTMTVGGVTLLSPSIYVCVLGGTVQAVAQAIWSRKIPGCPYYTGAGSTTTTVVDTNPLYAPPLPSYPVSFVFAQDLEFIVAVTLLDTAQIPSDAEAQIQAAMVNRFAGLAQTGWDQNDEPEIPTRLKIGSVVLSSDLAPAIQFLGSWARVYSLKIGSPNNPDAVFTAGISNGGGVAGTILNVTGVTSGPIVIGGTLFDSTGDVMAATIIQSQLSGATGGVGTYTVSISQLVLSESMVSASASRSEVDVGINQTPAVNPLNVTVVTHS